MNNLILAGYVCLLVGTALVQAARPNLADFDLDRIDELAGALSSKYSLRQHIVFTLLFSEHQIIPCFD